MRTTVTLDPDVEALLKKQMKERGLTFKQAVNDAIRAGLDRRARKPFRTPTFDMGPARFPIEKALHLAAELEDQDIIRKMRLGK